MNYIKYHNKKLLWEIATLVVYTRNEKSHAKTEITRFIQIWIRKITGLQILGHYGYHKITDTNEMEEIRNLHHDNHLHIWHVRHKNQISYFFSKNKQQAENGSTLKNIRATQIMRAVFTKLRIRRLHKQASRRRIYR